MFVSPLTRFGNRDMRGEHELGTEDEGREGGGGGEREMDRKRNKRQKDRPRLREIDR